MWRSCGSTPVEHKKSTKIILNQDQQGEEEVKSTKYTHPNRLFLGVFCQAKGKGRTEGQNLKPSPARHRKAARRTAQEMAPKKAPPAAYLTSPVTARKVQAVNLLEKSGFSAVSVAQRDRLDPTILPASPCCPESNCQETCLTRIWALPF